MNRKVVITGILGGIGFATADLFKKRGWYVIGIDRRQSRNKNSVIDEFYNFDIATPKIANKYFKKINNLSKSIDCLINTVGSQMYKPIRKIKVDSQYTSTTIYTIQTGSMIRITDAQKQFNSISRLLNKKELDFLRVEKIGDYYTVRLGKFEDYAAAENLLKTVESRLSTAIIMKAYFKNERIVLLYKDSLSDENHRVKEKSFKSIKKLNVDPQYTPTTIHTIQTGSMISMTDAQKQFDSISRLLNEKELNFLRIEKIGNYYAVRLGKFEDYATAENLLKAIKSRLSTAIIMKAYIKNERIILLYKDSLSDEKHGVKEKSLSSPVSE